MALPSRLHSDAPSVQPSADYQHAVHLYSHHDYRGALAALDRLMAAPERTGADRAFIQRQREICLAALQGGRSDQRPQTNDQRRRPRTPEQADCGPRALLIVCRRLGVVATVEELRRLAGTTGSGTTLEGLARAAQAKGLRAEGIHVDRDALANLNTPAIAWVDGDHFLAVLSVDGDQATLHDPNQPDDEQIPLDDLLRRSGGIFLTLH